MSKAKDPFEKWRGVNGALVLIVPVPEDLAADVAARMDGRNYPSFSIPKALPGIGCVELAYVTADRLVLELFTGPGMEQRWPADLAMQVNATVNAVRSEHDEAIEQRRQQRLEAQWTAEARHK